MSDRSISRDIADTSHYPKSLSTLASAIMEGGLSVPDAAYTLRIVTAETFLSVSDKESVAKPSALKHLKRSPQYNSAW